MLRGALPCLLLLPLAACAVGDARTEWSISERRSSTGEVMVVNSPPLVEVFDTVVATLRIGESDGTDATTFGDVKGVAVLADGRIAVLDAIAQELRVFSPEGAHLATYGGKGEGPGELQGAWGLMLSAAGELWVPDHSNNRMSVFHPDRGFLRSYRFPVLRYGYVWDGGMLHDGRIVTPSIQVGPPRKNVLRVYGTDMQPLDSLPVPDGPVTDPTDPPGSFYWSRPDGASGYMSVPFYPRGASVLDHEGAYWTAPGGDAGYQVLRWFAGGDTTLRFEVRRAPIPVSAAERDSAIAAVKERLSEWGVTTTQWHKIPSSKPPVLSMFMASDGQLWVQTSSPDSFRRFDVFDSRGHHVRSLVTAIALTSWVPPIVRGDTLWAVARDELDVPYIVRARITAGGH